MSTPASESIAEHAQPEIRERQSPDWRPAERHAEEWPSQARRRSDAAESAAPPTSATPYANPLARPRPSSLATSPSYCLPLSSNRNIPLLESGPTHYKQTIGPGSNPNILRCPQISFFRDASRTGAHKCRNSPAVSAAVLALAVPVALAIALYSTMSAE